MAGPKCLILNSIANPSIFRHGCGKTWHCHRLMTVPRKTSGGGRRRTEICEEVAKHLWYYGGKMAIWRCKGILRCEFMMPMPISYILYSYVVGISMEKEDPHFVCCDGFVYSNSN